MISIDGNNATIGISDYAQGELGTLFMLKLNHLR